MPDITWAANNGLIINSLTQDMMDAIRENGCVGFKIGLESGNPFILKKIRKPTSIEKFLAFSKISRHYPEMFITVNFILGFPEETFGQMIDTLKAALKGEMDWNNFYMYQPIKNTDFYTDYLRSVKKENVDTLEGTNQDFNFNPVRGGVFDKNNNPVMEKGYDVFQFTYNSVP